VRRNDQTTRSEIFRFLVSKKKKTAHTCEILRRVLLNHTRLYENERHILFFNLLKLDEMSGRNESFAFSVDIGIDRVNDDF
jgi:hypothetical protein